MCSKLLYCRGLYGVVAVCMASQALALSPRMPSNREIGVEFERGAIALGAVQRQRLLDALIRQPLQCVEAVYFSFSSLDSEKDDEQMWRIGKARATYVQELLQKSGGWPEGKEPSIIPTSSSAREPTERSTVTLIGC